MDLADDKVAVDRSALAELPFAIDRLEQGLTVGQPGHRVRTAAVARQLREPAQLGTGGDALPLVGQEAGGQEQQLGELARRRLAGAARGEQEADDLAVGGVERSRRPGARTEGGERLAVHKLAHRRRIGSDLAREGDRESAGGVASPRVDHPALAALPVDLGEHDRRRGGHRLEQVEDRHRGLGEAAEAPRGEPRQGMQELSRHFSLW